MKRLQNYFTLLIFVLALSFYGCSDDDDGNPTDPGNGGGTSSSVSGTVQLWSLGGGYTVKAQMEDENGVMHDLGSSEISSNGSFSLELTTPSNDWLTDTEFAVNEFTGDSLENCSGGLVSSDNQARGNSVLFNVYDGSDYVGEIVKAKINTTTFFFGGIAFWAYSDRAASVTGTVQCSNSMDGYTYNSNVTANINFVEGWNIAVIQTNFSNPDSVTFNTSIDISSGNADGMTWFFDDNGILGKKK